MDNQIKQFEKEDKLYADFYKDDNYYVDIHYVYVNRLNEIVKLRREPFILSQPNIIYRDELIGILKRNSIDDEVPYSIRSILKYNITLNVEDVASFIHQIEFDNFLSVINHIDDTRIDKTIAMFQDLNDLVFIFYEKTNNPNNVTKKVYITDHQKRRKTLRKQYKG